ITETKRVRPARRGIIQTSHVAVGVILIGESRKTESAKASHADVVVVVEAIESVQRVFDGPVETPAEKVFVERHRKISGALRERRNGWELLAVRVVAFVMEMPEELVFDDLAADAPADDLSIERRFFEAR